MSERKQIMRTAITAFAFSWLLVVTGCSNPSEPSNAEPKIVARNVPYVISTPVACGIHRGEVQYTTLVVNRGPGFKEDVRLDISAEGLRVIPSWIVVKGREPPEVRLQVTAASNAVPGRHVITVTGTSKSGATSSAEFSVNVFHP
ncbi:MAG TPA: hypothetical protein VL860_14310 [Planctomycetota bacterium]|nr:hypothetical protein [Planctomycetota bacterium]